MADRRPEDIGESSGGKKRLRFPPLFWIVIGGFALWLLYMLANSGRP